MSRDSILKYLILFVLGLLVYYMLRGNGLAIGGQGACKAKGKNSKHSGYCSKRTEKNCVSGTRARGWCQWDKDGRAKVGDSGNPHSTPDPLICSIMNKKCVINDESVPGFNSMKQREKNNLIETCESKTKTDCIKDPKCKVVGIPAAPSDYFCPVNTSALCRSEKLDGSLLPPKGVRISTFPNFQDIHSPEFKNRDKSITYSNDLIKIDKDECEKLCLYNDSCIGYNWSKGYKVGPPKYSPGTIYNGNPVPAYRDPNVKEEWKSYKYERNPAYDNVCNLYGPDMKIEPEYVYRKSEIKTGDPLKGYETDVELINYNYDNNNTIDSSVKLGDKSIEGLRLAPHLYDCVKKQINGIPNDVSCGNVPIEKCLNTTLSEGQCTLSEKGEKLMKSLDDSEMLPLQKQCEEKDCFLNPNCKWMSRNMAHEKTRRLAHEAHEAMEKEKSEPEFACSVTQKMKDSLNREGRSGEIEGWTNGCANRNRAQTCHDEGTNNNTHEWSGCEWKKNKCKDGFTLFDGKCININETMCKKSELDRMKKVCDDCMFFKGQLTRECILDSKADTVVPDTVGNYCSELVGACKGTDNSNNPVDLPGVKITTPGGKFFTSEFEKIKGHKEYSEINFIEPKNLFTEAHCRSWCKPNTSCIGYEYTEGTFVKPKIDPEKLGDHPYKVSIEKDEIKKVVAPSICKLYGENVNEHDTKKIMGNNKWYLEEDNLDDPWKIEKISPVPNNENYNNTITQVEPPGYGIPESKCVVKNYLQKDTDLVKSAPTPTQPQLALPSSWASDLAEGHSIMDSIGRSASTIGDYMTSGSKGDGSKGGGSSAIAGGGGW